MKHEYHYNGPVLYFDKILTNRWKGTTVAASRKKALSNLTYRVKKEAKLSNTSRVVLLDKYLTEGDWVVN